MITPVNACPPNVTLATPADQRDLLALLELRHREDGIGAFDRDAVNTTVIRGIFRDFSYIGVIRENRKLVASIGLYCGNFWYSSDPHLADFWNFVLPEHRKSTHAKSLLMFAKWLSDQLSLPLVMAKVENTETCQLLKLYERQLPKAGSLFVYNVGERVPA